jgi:carbonic anhydrase
MLTDKLMAGHRRFQERFAADHQLFTRLAEEGQEPKVFWIGCSDSRVIPEQITGADPGELLIMRNVANVVPPFGVGDNTMGAVIEYAILRLHVPHVVVCGHTECGGVKALTGHVDMAREPHLARWIEWIRPAHSQVEAAGVPEEARFLEMTKANVLLQRKNLHTYSCIREAAAAGQLMIHGWLYDLRTGDLLVYDDQSGQWGALIQPG